MNANDASLDQHRLINRKQLQELIPVSAMTIWRMEADGRLPQHRMIGGLAFWRLSDVLAAIAPPKSKDAASKTEGGVA